jgi:hypothetical protein
VEWGAGVCLMSSYYTLRLEKLTTRRVQNQDELTNLITAVAVANTDDGVSAAAVDVDLMSTLLNIFALVKITFQANLIFAVKT